MPSQVSDLHVFSLCYLGLPVSHRLSNTHTDSAELIDLKFSHISLSLATLPSLPWKKQTAATMGLLHVATSFLGLASTAASFPTWNNPNVQNDSVVVESLSSPPLGWVKNETQQINKEAVPIRLRMHLSHQNMDKFHEMALRVGPQASLYL